MNEESRQAIGGIGCCLCLNLTGKRLPREDSTVTVIAGYAVCEAHEKLAEHHDYNFQQLLQSARRDKNIERRAT